MKATDSSYNEVHKNETKAVDTLYKSIDSLHIKARCYNFGKQHKKGDDKYSAGNLVCHYCHKQGYFKKSA